MSDPIKIVSNTPPRARNVTLSGSADQQGENLSSSFEAHTKSLQLGTPLSVEKTYLIGITGGTASGKTTLAKEICSQLDRRSCLLLCLDSFYRPLTEDEKKDLESDVGFNFDVPSAFDFPLLLATLKTLIVDRQPTKIPIYDFVSSDRIGFEDVKPADVVIIEGILVLYWKEVREMMDLRIFVDTAPDTRLARRILRDIKERGRHVENILFQYERFVRPAFEHYIYPTKDFADIIVPRGSNNVVAINLIVEHIRGKIRSKRIILSDSEDVPVHHHHHHK